MVHFLVRRFRAGRGTRAPAPQFNIQNSKFKIIFNTTPSVTYVLNLRHSAIARIVNRDKLPAMTTDFAFIAFHGIALELTLEPMQVNLILFV